MHWITQVNSEWIASQGEANDDRNLALRAIEGDPVAFETLVRRHKSYVTRIARRIVGETDAEDVTQQTFLKAFIGLRNFQHKSAFRTWLVSIALNEARMWNRKVRQKKEISICVNEPAEDQSRSLDFPDPDPGPEARYADEEWSNLLHSAIERLKPSAREALQICDLEDLSVAEAAGLLGVSAAALKTRRSRGRAVLRGRLLRHLPRQPLYQERMRSLCNPCE